MSDITYYRGRDLGREVVFDFPSLVQTASREDMERYFVACLEERQAMSSKTATDEIAILFFKDTLAKVRAGLPLTSVRYSKA